MPVTASHHAGNKGTKVELQRDHLSFTRKTIRIEKPTEPVQSESKESDNDFIRAELGHSINI